MHTGAVPVQICLAVGITFVPSAIEKNRRPLRHRPVLFFPRNNLLRPDPIVVIFGDLFPDIEPHKRDNQAAGRSARHIGVFSVKMVRCIDVRSRMLTISQFVGGKTVRLVRRDRCATQLRITRIDGTLL